MSWLLLVSAVLAVPLHAEVATTVVQEVASNIVGHESSPAIEVRAHTSGQSPDAGSVSASGPQIVVMYLPACDGNDPNADTSADAMCPAVVALCVDTAPPDDLMFWRYTATRRPDGTRSAWARAGQACLRLEEVPAAGAPEFSLDDFRRLPLPPGEARVQPASGRTLVNVETNVYVEAGPVMLTTTLLGASVAVRATPVRFVWAFGDGVSLTTTDPGGPYPAMTTTHVYAERGERAVVLTTSYRGEYSVAGGPWLSIDGEAAVVSPPLAVQVFEARAELVQDLVTP